jgi:hypothetical protein
MISLQMRSNLESEVVELVSRLKPVACLLNLHLGKKLSGHPTSYQMRARIKPRSLHRTEVIIPKAAAGIGLRSLISVKRCADPRVKLHHFARKSSEGPAFLILGEGNWSSTSSSEL